MIILYFLPRPPLHLQTLSFLSQRKLLSMSQSFEPILDFSPLRCHVRRVHVHLLARYTHSMQQLSPPLRPTPLLSRALANFFPFPHFMYLAQHVISTFASDRSCSQLGVRLIFPPFSCKIFSQSYNAYLATDVIFWRNSLSFCIL